MCNLCKSILEMQAGVSELSGPAVCLIVIQGNRKLIG